MQDTDFITLGSYSPSNPSLWVESTSIQKGSSTKSRHKYAGDNIYTTDGLINGKNLEITATSTFTGAIAAQAVNVSSVAYNDASRLDNLTIKGGTTLEFRNKNNLPTAQYKCK